MELERIEFRGGEVVAEPEPLDRGETSIMINASSLEDGVLTVAFTFLAMYGKVSRIALDGYAYIRGIPEENASKVLEDERFKEELMSLISYSCMANATIVASAFNLPAPVITPKIKENQK